MSCVVPAVAKLSTTAGDESTGRIGAPLSPWWRSDVLRMLWPHRDTARKMADIREGSALQAPPFRLCGPFSGGGQSPTNT